MGNTVGKTNSLIHVNYYMSRKITHEEFLKIAENNNPYVDVIGIYMGMNNKIECRCKICEEIFYPRAEDVKYGKKHFICAHKIATKKRTKTLEQFQNEMKFISSDIQIIGPYINAKEKTQCRCIKHDTIFYSSPTHLLEGKTGCPECIKEKYNTPISHKEFLDKLTISNVEILSEYRGVKFPVQVRCLRCGFIWYPQAGSLIQGFGCPHCVGRHKTTKEFKDEILKINPYITIIGEYIDSKTKIECSCNECGHHWYAKPSNLKYTGCPKCCISHGERIITKFLDTHHINYETQKKYEDLFGIGGKNLSYDFYLPDYNLLIEYQGEFHDGSANKQTKEEFKRQQEHDKRKKQYANKHKIPLLEIWYWDFNIIEEILERELCVNELDPVEITAV